MSLDSCTPLQLIPEYRDYVWGGHRLRPSGVLTAEAWIVYEHDRIASGECQGRTLAEIAAENPDELLGPRVVQQTGTRFPILIKLLDCADWLSLQVHPNDEQALRLEGPGHFGKTEAWHVLEAAEGAHLVAGLQPGISPHELETAIRNSTIEKWVKRWPVQAGETVFMPPGTLHALGPDLLIYEVQQTSDLTYRVYDWGRPQTPNRVLHIDKAVQVVDHHAQSEITPLKDQEHQFLVHSNYFTLERIAKDSGSASLNTRHESFHALTVTRGQVRVHTAHGGVDLKQYDTAIVPAAAGSYQVQAAAPFELLVASAG